MTTDVVTPDEVIIACDPHAVSPEQQQRWVSDILPRLYLAVQELKELPDGYAFRLPADPNILMLAAEDLNMERLCCPFIRYTLEVEPNRGPFWLRMTGSEEIKAFLRMGFETANLLDEAVARAAGLNVTAAANIKSVETTLEAVDQLNERFAASQRPSEIQEN